jgi:hypothetical protein
MKQIKIYGVAAGFVMCILLLAAGCADTSKAPETKTGLPESTEARIEPEKTTPAEAEPQKQEPPVELALKFAPEDSTTYKVTIGAEKSIKWEGPTGSKPSAFKGGQTGSTIETTFTQQIQSTDEGNAVAKITIKDLRYLQKVKNNIILDFDSSRAKDVNSPLNKLIGQSYTIEITAFGQVSQVIEASDARAAVNGASTAHKTAVKLLSDDVIKERHTIPALPPADRDQLRTNDDWSSIKSFSFDMMGSKSYEKVYTLKEVKNTDGRRVAIAQMNAIPSAEMAKELHKEQATSFFSKMFDNTERYTGELRLDLTDGKVQECREELITEWMIVDPSPKGQEQPAALKMAATRLYSIERTD